MLNQEPQVANEAPAGAPVLALTDAAAAKVLELAKGETNPLIGLRVYIVSGGCSGYRYGMMLDDVENPGDSVFMANGVRVYVDEKAVPLIKGSTVDYVDAMMGAGFTVINGGDRKSTRLNSSHSKQSRMPSSA